MCERCATVLGLPHSITASPAAHARSRDGEDSLMRSNTVEIVNLCVGCVCLVPLLAVGAWFAARWAAAARCPTTVRWGRQRRYLLWMTGADIALQLLNLAMYLAANIYSLVRPCAWFGVAMDVFFFLSMTSERRGVPWWEGAGEGAHRACAARMRRGRVRLTATIHCSTLAAVAAAAARTTQCAAPMAPSPWVQPSTHSFS